MRKGRKWESEGRKRKWSFGKAENIANEPRIELVEPSGNVADAALTLSYRDRGCYQPLWHVHLRPLVAFICSLLCQMKMSWLAFFLLANPLQTCPINEAKWFQHQHQGSISPLPECNQQQHYHPQVCKRCLWADAVSSCRSRGRWSKQGNKNKCHTGDRSFQGCQNNTTNIITHVDHLSTWISLPATLQAESPEGSSASIGGPLDHWWYHNCWREPTSSCPASH